MVTTRLGVDGSYNAAYGLDGVIRLFGDEYLTVRWAQTLQEGSENNPVSLDPTKFRAHWERRKRGGILLCVLRLLFREGFQSGYWIRDF